MSREVLVAHPGTQHSYEAVVALQDAGLLSEYITGLYVKGHAWPYRLNCLLTRKARYRLFAHLGKRQRAGLNEALIRTHWWIEGAFVVARHHKMPRWLTDHAFHLRNHRFHRVVAKRVEVVRPSAILCYDCCGAEVFKSAAKVGAIKVLDQTCCHLTTSALVVERENLALPLGLKAKLPPQWQLRESRDEARQADLILAGSGFVKNSLIKIGIQPDKVVILPYGVDLELFSPAFEKRDSTRVRAIFAGQLTSRKGVNYLLQAFHGLDRKNCGLLLVGGSGKDAAALRRFDFSFDHIPFAPRSELASHYQASDFFVFPSLLEGSALVTYEALASGLPVITTPNSGSVVRDGVDGFIVPPHDVEVLRNRIERLANSAELRHAMGVAARKRAEEYSWKNYHKRLVEIIGNQLAQRKSSEVRTEPESTRLTARVS
jgi:glycosyltransferase involved in cell wall biosynthesis